MVQACAILSKLVASLGKRAPGPHAGGRPPGERARARQIGERDKAQDGRAVPALPDKGCKGERSGDPEEQDEGAGDPGHGARHHKMRARVPELKAGELAAMQQPLQ